MKLSVYFLILATVIVFDKPILAGAFTCAGYYVFSSVDEILARRRKLKLWDKFTLWEKDPEDPEMENRGNLTRVRLEGESQQIVARVTEFVSQLP
jgi:hypothetical protein